MLESQQKCVYTDLTSLMRELPHSLYLSYYSLIKTMPSKRKNPPSWLQDFRRYTIVPNWILMAFEGDCRCELCLKIREEAEDLRDLFTPRRRPSPPEMA